MKKITQALFLNLHSAQIIPSYVNHVGTSPHFSKQAELTAVYLYFQKHNFEFLLYLLSTYFICPSRLYIWYAIYLV